MKTFALWAEDDNAHVRRLASEGCRPLLPWGMRSAHEEGAEVEKGHDRAAPVRVNMKQKFLVTTLVTLVVYSFYYWLVNYSGFSIDDIPFLPRIERI